jgi:cytidylate kinase
MNDLFLKYMSNRFITEYEKDLNKQQKSGPGPVITISRETGCSGSVITKMLYDKIQSSFYNDKLNSGSWKLMDKEVLQLAAKTLEIDPCELNYVFKHVERKAIAEMISSLSSKYYHSDRKIKLTIINVIRGMAERGNIIFLGRGFVSVTRNIKNSLHVRLIAPLDWRIKQVVELKNISPKEAEALIMETDARRIKLVECFGGKNDNTMFDVIYNAATLTREEIVDQIFTLANNKGFF